MYQELALLQEILDSIDRHGSVGLASLPIAALTAQFSCFERSRQDVMLELLRDIQRDVGADYALYDEVYDLQLSTKEAVDQALLKSEKFRRAQAAKAAAEAGATAIANSEAKATAVATAVADSEEKAAAVETKFPANNVKLNVERDVTPEAMTPDAVSPTAGGSVVVTPDAGAHPVPDRHILAPAAGGSEVMMPDAGAHRVPVRHILAPAAGGSEVVTLDAKTSDAGTTDSRTSDTKMLDARAPLGEGTQGSPDVDHPNSSEGQGQPHRPPRPLEQGEDSDGIHPSRAPLSNSREPKRPPRPQEPGENSNGIHPSRAPISNGWEPQRPPRPPEPGENSDGTHTSRASLSSGWKP